MNVYAENNINDLIYICLSQVFALKYPAFFLNVRAYFMCDFQLLLLHKNSPLCYDDVAKRYLLSCYLNSFTVYCTLLFF